MTNKIESFSNFLSAVDSQKLYHYLLNSSFKIGWDDSDEPQHKSYPNLFTEYSLEELKNLNILGAALKLMQKYGVTIDDYLQCRVNLSKPCDVNFIHFHPHQLVLLYYCNLSWFPEWGGETLFYEEDKKNIKCCNIYEPNKALVFDGSLPHTIKSQNILGPTYRFTLNLFFKKHGS